MCGIFAILNNSREYKTILHAFQAGKNRGPEFSVLTSHNNAISGFHRLAINGLNNRSNQPIIHNNISLICNGEIYNYKQLALDCNIKLVTESDCEIIIHLYEKYGLPYMLNMLDAEFAFVLLDARIPEREKIIVARDPYGVRPLYRLQNNDTREFAFASELKSLYPLTSPRDNKDKDKISVFMPGTYAVYENLNMEFRCNLEERYTGYPFREITSEIITEEIVMREIYNNFANAVKKRVVGTTERPIACLLSGGLDSSCVAALASKFYDGVLETYSIGLEGGEDFKYANIVAKHLGTRHTNIVLTEDEFFDAIPKVIQAIESYDTTTVRASVGNYLIGEYIAKHSQAKVILNGDGSDELMGGYLYFHKCPDSIEFDIECKRLLSDIHYFDVLRSDKCISSHGLEPRTPFLDRGWVEFYLGLKNSMRNHVSNNKNPLCEKYLFRNAIHTINPDLLPSEVLWRKKEAFSDGVSSLDRSWYSIIQEKIDMLCDNSPEFKNRLSEMQDRTYNTPANMEQCYYRYLYELDYKATEDLTPYFWMPKFIDAEDASARTLAIY